MERNRELVLCTQTERDKRLETVVSIMLVKAFFVLLIVMTIMVFTIAFLWTWFVFWFSLMFVFLDLLNLLVLCFIFILFFWVLSKLQVHQRAERHIGKWLAAGVRTTMTWTLQTFQVLNDIKCTKQQALTRSYKCLCVCDDVFLCNVSLKQYENYKYISVRQVNKQVKM